jgi:hypothetical protein
MASKPVPKAPKPAEKEDYNAIVSTFTSRFGPDAEDPAQAKVTEAERKKRQETAAQGADQYVPLFSPSPVT